MGVPPVESKSNSPHAARLPEKMNHGNTDMPNTIPFQSNNITVGTSLTMLLQIPLAGLDSLISFQLRQRRRLIDDEQFRHRPPNCTMPAAG